MGTGADSEKMNAKPFAINMTPRVTMNAGMLNSVTTPPVPKPMAAQPILRRCRAEIASGGITATELLIVSAAMTPLNAMRLPTDRSMPAVIMTIVIPMAMMATMEICLSTLSRLSRLRKFGHLCLIGIRGGLGEVRIFPASLGSSSLQNDHVLVGSDGGQRRGLAPSTARAADCRHVGGDGEPAL